MLSRQGSGTAGEGRVIWHRQSVGGGAGLGDASGAASSPSPCVFSLQQRAGCPWGHRGLLKMGTESSERFARDVPARRRWLCSPPSPRSHHGQDFLPRQAACSSCCGRCSLRQALGCDGKCCAGCGGTVCAHRVHTALCGAGCWRGWGLSHGLGKLSYPFAGALPAEAVTAR